MAGDGPAADVAPERAPLGEFLTPRRAAGLVGASVLATLGYGLVTDISALNAGIFFVVFLAVFAALNFALWRYD